jgi:hypothetical protein
MIECWTLATNGLGPRTPKETGTRLYRQVWLKRSPRFLSPTTSRPNCCGISWPTPLAGSMGQEILPLQLWPPTATSRPLTRRSSLRQESLLRLITGFGWWSTSLASYAALRCRRPSSPRSSCVVTPVHGGSTTPPLASRTTKCYGEVLWCFPRPLHPHRRDEEEARNSWI